MPPPARVEPGRPMAPGYVEHGRPMPPRPIYVEAPPPRVRYEAPPPRPSATHIWIGGYWGWENDEHVWIEGRWAAPPEPGYQWEQARWRRQGHRWMLVPGHWHRHGHVWVEPMVGPPAYVEPAPGYAAPAPAYEAGNLSISGYVTSMQGTPVAGITVTLAGSREGRIVTDGSGFYVFSGLPFGSYSVRPVGGGCAFAPDVVNLNNLGSNVTQNITVSGCGGW
jgi:Carboxypeptidase regulatory-like domain/WXXGXW repeat (2 copies)